MHMSPVGPSLALGEPVAPHAPVAPHDPDWVPLSHALSPPASWLVAPEKVGAQADGISADSVIQEAVIPKDVLEQLLGLSKGPHINVGAAIGAGTEAAEETAAEAQRRAEEFAKALRDIVVDQEPIHDPEAPNATKGKLIAELKAVIDGGELDVRSGLGQRFARSHKKRSPEGDEYAKCSTTCAKNKFRLAWAKVFLTECEEEYNHIESESIVLANTRVFLPFRKIWEEEGLDSDGYEAEPFLTYVIVLASWLLR